MVLPSADVRGFGRVLQQRGFQVFVRDGALYAFRGLGGKLGPIGVHAAMLAIMGGAHFTRSPSCVAPPTLVCCTAWRVDASIFGARQGGTHQRLGNVRCSTGQKCKEVWRHKWQRKDM